MKTVQLKGVSALGLLTAALFGGSFLLIAPSARVGSWLILAAGLQSMAAFWALLWALPRSNRAFFSVFVGDALVRVVGLGAVVCLLASWKVPYTVPLVSLAFAHILFSVAQIPFFSRVR